MVLATLSSGTAILAIASRFTVGLVLVLAAAPKILDLATFERAVADYQLLGPRLVRMLSRALPFVEALCGVMLLAGLFVPVAGTVAAVLLVSFAAAVGLNLIRGRAIDCGCGGAGISREIAWDLVAADFVLAGAALIAAVENTTVLEPSAPQLLGHAAPFGSREALAVLVIVVIAVLLRELAWAYARLKVTMGSASTTREWLG